MTKRERTYYFQHYSDDMVTSSNQHFELQDDYDWIPKGILAGLKSSILYTIAYSIGRIYLWAHLRWKMRNKDLSQSSDSQGIIIYCNHTQPIGDVLMPAYAVNPRRIFTLASPSNLGIPVIGRILKYLGALPIPTDRHAIRKLKKAISLRLEQNACIVIYPEEHVWPYCTFIRPFNEAAFSFAVDANVPVYAMTTTYVKRLFGRKPKAISYLDGPFFASKDLARPKARKALLDQVQACMRKRAELNNCEYIHYEKEEVVQ